MGQSSDLPPRRKRNRKNTTNPGTRPKPGKATAGRRRSSQNSRGAAPWWEDWRWLVGIAGVLLTTGLTILLLRNRPETVVVEQPAQQPLPEAVEPEAPEKQIPALTTNNTERAMAEWIIDKGGSVTVVDDTDAIFYATQKSQLPDAPQRVTAAFLSDITDLSDDDLQKLSGCLVIQELHLDRTKVTDTGLNNISPLVTLQRLALEDTEITEAGLSAISKLTQLRFLSLSVPLSDAGLSELRNLKDLQGFRFSGKGATDTGLKQVCDAFPQLTHLATDEMALTDAGVEPLQKLSGLRLLGLTRAPVSDDSVDRLGKLSTLTHLLIPGTQITTDGTQRLRQSLPNCQIFGGKFDPARFLAAQILLEGGKLSISIGDAEPQTVAKIDELPEDGINYHAIDLSGVRTLRRGSLNSLLLWRGKNVLRGVRSLSLADSSVDPHDLNSLPALIDGLQILNLRNTAANDSNYKLLQKLYWLTDTLNIEGTQFSEDMLSTIRIHFRGGCHILDGTGIPDPKVDRQVAEWVLSVGGFVHVELHGPAGPVLHHGKDTVVTVNRQEQLPDKPFYVRYVDLTSCEGVRDDDFARFVPLRRLYQVRFGNCQVSDACLKHLENIPTLWLMTMYGCKPGFTDEGMKSLAKLPNIGFMHLQFHDITAQGIRNLGLKPSIDSIIFSGKQIDDAALQQITENLPNLRSLNVTGCSFTDTRLSELSKLTNLKSLTLTSDKLTDRGGAAICGLQNLESISVGGVQITEAAFLPLLDRDGVKHVGLTGAAVSFPLVEKLRTKHPGITFEYGNRDGTLIRFLKMGAKVTGSSSIRQIEALIEENQFPAPDFVVQKIDFEGAELPERFSFDSVRYIPEVVEVSLKGTGAQVAGFEFLSSCRNLSTLNLEGTRVEDVHLEQCKPLPSLKLINLRGTGVSKELIETLKRNSRSCRILHD